MGSINRVSILGRLGADPETRQAGGSTVCNMRIATDDRWTDRDGNKQEKTEWHRVTAWGRTAEACGQYLRKGSQAFVEGSLETKEWTDKDGNKRYTTEIKARNVVFVGSRGDGQRQGGGQQGSRQGQGNYSAPSASTLDDDDLPF